ncbi:MAG: S-adenosylmethionine:tRNA ribosyltransferase-isomerase [bacterium]
MPGPGKIALSRFSYDLPQERIAQFPLERRDESRLLVYRNGIITGDLFTRIDHYLPEGALLVFNDTRVIHARLQFKKPGGAGIEIFCLEPLDPPDFQLAFRAKEFCRWKCLVGNLKRWKGGDLVLENLSDGKIINLTATRTEDLGDGCHAIAFTWDPPELPFLSVLETIGQVPLPPYIHRPAEAGDDQRYQTIYAKNNGSVAAPTAGLHFTPEVLSRLEAKGSLFEKVTLHVGLGTFRPVTVPDISEHMMHAEQIIVKKKTIETLYNNPERPVIAVGTTSVRTLESLYWLGVKLTEGKTGTLAEVGQWDPYLTSGNSGISLKQSLGHLLEYLERNDLDALTGSTRLMIVPGYSYKVTSGLITNFHMPQSTLLLLVAALIGNDWEKAYRYALDHSYRFLSYGDSCLFFKNIG